MSIDTVEQFIGDVTADLERFTEELWNDYVPVEPAHLFHYTSTEGLLGIINTRKFFLSDMFASTDQSEIRQGIEIVRGILEESQPDDWMSRGFLGALGKDGLWWGLGTEFFVHAICFCRGDDVLTQWRGFAADRGVAIGVDFAALKQQAEKAEFAFGRMLYEPDKQREMVRKILDHGRQYAARLQKLFTDIFDPAAKTARTAMMTEVGTSLLKSLLLFKHSAFQSEDEWRVLKLEPRDELAQKLQFRASASGVIPYIELSFDATTITHIRCSPGPWSRSALYGVHRLAESLGDHVQVTRSTIPL